MQMIAEAYGILRDGLGMEASAIADTFARWNDGPLESYLIEISATVAAAIDPGSGQPLLDVILDRAGQKGTGRWTAIEALHLGRAGDGDRGGGGGAQPLGAPRRAARRARRSSARPRGASTPTTACSPTWSRRCSPARSPPTPRASACWPPHRRSSAGTCRCPTIARVWRAGCIIRSAMLDDMAAALDAQRGNLMFAPSFAERLRRHPRRRCAASSRRRRSAARRSRRSPPRSPTSTPCAPPGAPPT